MFRGIYKLPAGHSATFRDGELTIRQYWDLTFPAADHDYPRSEENLAEETRDRFRESVTKQMVSDVPVGAFLSAGLDSSSIVAMMARTSNRPIQTYTVTFPKKYRIGENALDDPEVATRTSAELGIENHRIVVDPDVVNLLPKLIWHMDEPTADPAIIAAYLVCRAAREHSTVMLSGVGGDELFGGYRKYVAHYWANTYQRLPDYPRSIFERGVNSLPNFRGHAAKGWVRLAKKMARSGSLPPAEGFITNCTYLNDSQRENLLSDEFLDELPTGDVTADHHAAFTKVRHADFLNQMLYVDSKIFMTTSI